MKQPRVAHRYAKALLALSKETNKTDEVFQDMNLISKTVSDSKDFASVLKSPIVKSDKKAAIFTAIFSSKVSELTNK